MSNTNTKDEALQKIRTLLGEAREVSKQLQRELKEACKMDLEEKEPYGKYWLLIIWDGIEPKLNGPWSWEDLLAQARSAKHHHGNDHGLFYLRASADDPLVGSFAASVFEDLN